MELYKLFALLILAAALQILSLSPLNLYWLAFVFVVPILFLLEREKRLWAALIGFFIYRIIAMTGIVYFVFDPIMFAASTIILLGFPLTFWFVKKIWNEKLAFLLTPIYWTFWDYLSSRYTALPNFVMIAGNSLGNSPFLGLASFWGVVSLTFFVLLVNLFTFLAIQYWRKNRQLALIAAAAAFMTLMAGWLISLAVLRENRYNYETRPGNTEVILVSQKEGLDYIFRKELNEPELELRVNRVLNDLKSNLKEKNFDLLVLPDLMFDVAYDITADSEAFSKFGITTSGVIISGYRKFAQDIGKNLAASAIVFTGGKKYNTFLFFDKNGTLTDVFYKKYLAITGEYWPFGNWRPFYFNWPLKADPEKYYDYAIFNPDNNYSSGKTKIIQVGEIILAPSICIEIHYPAEMRRRVAMGASAILNTSSNLWAPIPGLDQYLRITDNLRRIESVWLKTPILVNGRKEPPSIVLPDGSIKRPNSKAEIGDYQIMPVKVKF